MVLPRNRVPSHPGEILLEEFLKPMQVTQVAFALHLGWTKARVSEIVNGHRGVSADTALAFSECFGTSPEFWLNLQSSHDLHQASQKHVQAKPLLVS
jgi:addiction module HigA family antidote